MLCAGWVWLSVRTMVLTWLLGPGALEGVHFFVEDVWSCGGALARLPLEPSQGLEAAAWLRGHPVSPLQLFIAGGRAPPQFYTTRFLAVSCVVAWLFLRYRALTYSRRVAAASGREDRRRLCGGAFAGLPLGPSRF